MYKYGFEKLEIWQIAVKLSVVVYEITKKYPSEERFGITNQLRRASTSISANIAEGHSRISSKEKARFLEISYGSLMEVLNFLILSKELRYINENELLMLRKTVEELSNKINAYHKKLKKS